MGIGKSLIVTRLNSIIFHTQNLTSNKDFYQKVFNLKVGSYEKDGINVPDESISYVNFDMNGVLLCFELGSHTDRATLVLNVDDFDNFKDTTKGQGIEILKQGDSWLKIKDPDGRSVIVEQNKCSQQIKSLIEPIK
jgi:predicted enzyme related to lactoylglutathione lyase